MTEFTKNNDVRSFLGLPIEGDKGYIRYRCQYTPRPIEDLYPYFKTAFENGIKAITWQQYTPSSNDGEPCEFSVHEVAGTNNTEVAENWLDNNFYEDRLVEVDRAEYDAEVEASKNSRYRYYLPYEEIDGKIFKRYEQGTYDYIPGSSHPDNIKDLDIPIHKLEFEDALRTKFGDHTRVVVTPERVVQFEYSYD